MRSTQFSRLAAIALVLLSQCPVSPAQQKTSAVTGVNWTPTTGNGAPTSTSCGGTCTSTFYGLPYTDLTNQNQYVYTGSGAVAGWMKVNSAGGGGGSVPGWVFASQTPVQQYPIRFQTAMQAASAAVIADPTLPSNDLLGYIVNGYQFISSMGSFGQASLAIDTRNGAFNTFHYQWTPGLSSQGAAEGPTCLVQLGYIGGGTCYGITDFALESGYNNGNFNDGDAGWNGDTMSSSYMYNNSAGIHIGVTKELSFMGVGDWTPDQTVVHAKPGMTAPSDEGGAAMNGRIKFDEALPYMGTVTGTAAANTSDLVLTLAPSRNMQNMGVGHPVLDETYDVLTGTATISTVPTGAGQFAGVTTSWTMPVSTQVALSSTISAAQIGAPLSMAQNAIVYAAVNSSANLSSLVGAKSAFQDSHYDTDAVLLAAGVAVPAWVSGTQVALYGFTTNGGELFQAAHVGQPNASPTAGPYWNDIGPVASNQVLQIALRHAHGSGTPFFIGGAAGRWLDFAITDTSYNNGTAYTLRYPMLVFGSTSAHTLVGGFEGPGQINQDAGFPWQGGPFTATLFHGSHDAQVHTITVCNGGSCQLTSDGKSVTVAGSEPGVFAAGAVIEEQGTAVQDWGHVGAYAQVFDPMASVSGPSITIDGNANKYPGDPNWGYQLVNLTGNALEVAWDFRGPVSTGLHFTQAPDGGLINIDSTANIPNGNSFPVMDFGTVNPTMTYTPSENTLEVKGSILKVSDGFTYTSPDQADIATATFTNPYGGSYNGLQPVAMFENTSQYTNPVVIFSGDSGYAEGFTNLGFAPFEPLLQLQNTNSEGHPWFVGVAGNQGLATDGQYTLAYNVGGIGSPSGQTANVVQTCSANDFSCSFSKLNVNATGDSDGNQAAAFYDANISTGHNVYFAFGKAFAQGEAAFLVFQNNTLPYGSLQTYANANPMEIAGSNIWLDGGPVYVGNSNANGSTTASLGGGLFNVGSANQFQVDGNGGITGPATAPSGSCSKPGSWQLSQDGHATVCNAGTWQTKI